MRERDGDKCGYTSMNVCSALGPFAFFNEAVRWNQQQAIL